MPSDGDGSEAETSRRWVEGAADLAGEVAGEFIVPIARVLWWGVRLSIRALLEWSSGL